jgi:hypothetical protein
MDRSQRQAVLLSLIQHLRDNGSWCGETHFQKSAFFLQELLKVPLDLNVIFYKYGPYSFDLSDEITALRADLLLTVQARDPYGPSLLLSENAATVLARYPATLARYGPAIRFVAERLGPKNVSDLERLATALYVSLRKPQATAEEQAEEITQLKPHVSLDDAGAALQAVSRMRTEMERLDRHDPAPPSDRG